MNSIEDNCVCLLNRVSDLYKADISIEDIPLYRMKATQYINEIDGLVKDLSSVNYIWASQMIIVLNQEQERLVTFLSSINQMDVAVKQHDIIDYHVNVNDFLKQLKEFLK